MIIWIGVLCNVLFPIPMIIATARGEQRPSRVSFFMWTTEAAIAFAASAAAGAGIGALVVSGAAAAVLGAVFVATFVPQLRGRHIAVDPAPWWQAWVDRLCLTVCALALFGWWLTSNPLVALVLAITTDAVAAIPTFVRGWRGEEDWFPYLGFAINAGCAFVVITDWALAQWAFTYYQLVVCVLLTLVPLLRNEPGRGLHGRAVPTRRWGRTTAAAGGLVAILAAGAVVAGILPRPTGSTPPLPVAARARGARAGPGRRVRGPAPRGRRGRRRPDGAGPRAGAADPGLHPDGPERPVRADRAPHADDACRSSTRGWRRSRPPSRRRRRRRAS